MTKTKSCQGIKASLKKALPCREEKYVPLPVGGYGLPAIVRRKFSFPAQLPNVSVLSLLPDFNSTQYNHVDASLESRRPPQPSSEPHAHPLRVKYSLIQPTEPSSEVESRASTPHLRRKAGRISRASLALSVPEIEDHGETDDSISHTESLSDATTAVSVTPPTKHSTIQTTKRKNQLERLAPIKPRSPQQTRFERLLREGKVAVPIKDQIAWKFKQYVPQILKTFCVTDLQFPGHPIAVVSKDVLPRQDLRCDEAHYLSVEPPKEPSQICVETHNGRKTYRVTLQEDLYSCCGNYDRPTHRYIGHVDLTEFVESVRFGESDIWSWEPLSPDHWLRLAHEYMREDGHSIEDPPIRYEAKKVSKAVRLDTAMEVIDSLYRDCFVFGLSKTSPGLYETTHVSQSVLDLSRRNKNAPDLAHLAPDFARGECFYSDIFWDTHKRLYCIPMFGPKPNCWLCFMVDRSLPAVW